jgi:cation transport ATPase
MGKEDIVLAFAIIVLFIVVAYGMTLQMMTAMAG